MGMVTSHSYRRTTQGARPMHHSSHRFPRWMSAAIVALFVVTGLLVGPAPSALANGPEKLLFRAEFDSAPLGPLTAPLIVETGTIVPQAGTLAIVAGTSGRRLQLDSSAGQATALMRWSNYPGPLPTTSQGALTVRIT